MDGSKEVRGHLSTLLRYFYQVSPETNGYQEWYGSTGWSNMEDISTPTGRKPWPSGLWERTEEVLSLELDCEGHFLRLTCDQTGKTSIIEGPPSKEFFPFFRLSCSGDKVEFLG